MKTERQPEPEDDDPLVVAAERAALGENIQRKPGLLVFRLDGPGGSGLIVRRSRFEGDYGNICRMSLASGKHVGPAIFAPCVAVLEAIMGCPPGEAFGRLMSVYEEWSKKGE